MPSHALHKHVEIIYLVHGLIAEIAPSTRFDREYRLIIWQDRGDEIKPTNRPPIKGVCNDRRDVFGQMCWTARASSPFACKKLAEEYVIKYVEGLAEYFDKLKGVSFDSFRLHPDYARTRTEAQSLPVVAGAA